MKVGAEVAVGLEVAVETGLEVIVGMGVWVEVFDGTIVGISVGVGVMVGGSPVKAKLPDAFQLVPTKTWTS